MFTRNSLITLAPHVHGRWHTRVGGTGGRAREEGRAREGEPRVITQTEVAGIDNERKGEGERAHRWRDEQV